VEESTRRQLASPDLEGCDSEIQTTLRSATERGSLMLAQALRAPGEAAAVHHRNGAPFAQTAAQHGIPLAAVLQGYRLSHAAAVDHLLGYAAEIEAPMSCLTEPMRNLFWYMDSMIEVGSRAYVAERRRINSRPERAKFLRVKAVLEGGTDLGMSYPLDSHHVAIAIRTSHSGPALTAVAQAAGRAPLLVVEAPDGKIFAWVACDLCEDEVVKALKDNAHGPISAGVSGNEPGVEGFRAANRKARLALQLGPSHGTSVTTFADIALEALAVGGDDLAREFVRAEMGRLADGDRRTAALRETLTEYFSARGAAAAAERLGVSERTVTYRLRHAETVLGRPLSARRAELETALRLHRLLGNGAGMSIAA